MLTYPEDIYTEPDTDPDTLAHLGPLAALAGTWEGPRGIDDHPVAGGGETTSVVERYVATPIDAQTNGPQLFYGLRYHTRLVEVGSQETFHDQVGYWLWEPNQHLVLLTLAIPRGQSVLAGGRCAPDAVTFQVHAQRGSTVYGIVSNPFLDTSFTTTDFRMTVTVHPDGSWSYDETTRLVIPDRDRPYEHRDRNTLTRVAPPEPNPLARALGARTSAEPAR